MRIYKKHPYLQLVNSYLIDSPSPSNISYFWNYGSLLGFCLIIQILSGIFLAMHYIPNIDLAFLSVEHIMRDVPNGWLMRYIHANGASMFFIMVFLHIGKGIYYGSYNKPRILLWNIGVIIFLLMIGTAFLGYTLPWGQMSLWGATVITNLLSAIPWIGNDLVMLIWGNYAVDNATLNRFYALHYLLPFLLVALVLLHLIALHINGSNNPLGHNSNIDKIPFHPYFVFKDLHGFVLFLLFFSFFLFSFPNFLGHSDNYIPANPLVTPPSIVPEWYLLTFYAILRSIPDKLGGVIAMFSSILILLLLPYLHTFRFRSSMFRPFYKFLFWFFLGDYCLLGWLGSQHVEFPYILLGQICTFFYFFYFLFFLPFLGILENILFSFHFHK